MREPLKSDGIDRFAGAQKIPVTRDIGGRESSDLFRHGRIVTGTIEKAAVVETNSIKRLQSNQFYIVLEAAAAQAP